MAQEAILTDRIGNPIDFTVTDGGGIEKGALLRLLDDRVASGAKGVGSPIAGIAAREKVAGDERTQLAVWRSGIFRMRGSGAILLGDAVQIDGTGNWVRKALVNSSGARTLGTALNTSAAGEEVSVDVNIGVSSSLS